MEAYRIREWDSHFENSQTKRIKGDLKWVSLPTKQDGKSFRRLMRNKDGAAIFGVWVLLIEIAAKCPTRGILADEDGPLTPNDIADKTDVPAEVIAKALKVLSSEQIGWIDAPNLLQPAADMQQPVVDPLQPVADGCRSTVVQESTVQESKVNPPSVGADAPSPAEAGQRTARPKVSDPLLENPGMIAFRDCHHQWPSQGGPRELIAATVTDQVLWARVLSTWKMRGNKPTNVEGQIEWYKHGIPQQGFRGNYGQTRQVGEARPIPGKYAGRSGSDGANKTG